MYNQSRVLQLLEEMLESKSTPEEVCSDCPELLPIVRERWERLRGVEAQLESLFPTPNSDSAQPGDWPASPLRSRPSVPGYDIGEILGRGGVGVVFKARHLKLNRPVALKMLLAGGYASTTELKRFMLEAESVASLRHANLVQIYDVGDLDGCPYFTMEYLEGGTLAQKLAAVPVPSAQAAALLTTLADAMQAAHAGGIIHRDLKPSNILLAADGTPKISDFGLARRFQGQSDLTISGAGVGTPCYMAPEQAKGRANTVGPLADVYSLGAILYEMLTGRPPFQGETPGETESQLIAVDPVPPSRLNPKVPRDLEIICLKCLQKLPDKRYASAADLAADLGRFTRNEPIHARPVGVAEHCLRWMLRHKGLAVALAGVVFLLMLLVAGSLVAAEHFRKSEQIQHALAAVAAGEREQAVKAGGREVQLRKKAEDQENALRRNLYLAQMNLGGQAAMSPSGIGRVLERLAPWEYTRPDLRDWEWYYLNGLCHRDASTLGANTLGVLDMTWSPDGRMVASAGQNGAVAIWNVEDQREILHLYGHKSIVHSLAWSPDSKRLASGSWDRTIRIWNAQTGAVILTFAAHTANIYSVSWSRDGTRIASGDDDGTIQIWDPDTGTSIHVLHGHKRAVTSIAWSPDGSRLASSEDVSVHVWDSDSGKELKALLGHQNWVKKVAWNPDGTRLASASNDDTAKIWDTTSGRDIFTLTGHTQEVSSVAWSPDGTRLATGSDDQTVKVWEANTGLELYTLRGHTYPITSVAWGPDGRSIASGSYDQTTKIWDTTAGPETPALADHTGPITSLAWRGDSARLASASDDGTVKIWDMPTHRARFTPRSQSNPVRSTAWSPDGHWLASGGMDQMIHVWDADTGVEQAPFNDHNGEIFAVRWSPDGKRLASASADRTIRIRDARTGREIMSIRGLDAPVHSLAWSPDGMRLAGGDWSRHVTIWTVETGLVSLALKTRHTAEINAVAWSPDGQRLAAASADQTISVSSASTGNLAMTLRGHTSRVNDVCWSPSGARLASGSEDQTIKIWDAVTGQETLTFDCGCHLYAVAWSPDGMALACGGSDQKIRIYDASAGYANVLAPQYISVLNSRIRADRQEPANWRLLAQIHAGMGDWDHAAADLHEYLRLKTDEHWFSLGFWVAGPYSDDLDARYPPEVNPDPGKLVAEPTPADASTKFLNWAYVPLNPAGFINFGTLFDGREHISGYALRKIYCPQSRQVAILIGADDKARLWLNGDKIYEDLGQHDAVADADAVGVTLVPGWNTLLARVVNVTGAHALYLRLSDAPADLARARHAAKQ